MCERIGRYLKYDIKKYMHHPVSTNIFYTTILKNTAHSLEFRNSRGLRSTKCSKQNASKFAISYIILENPSSFFRFSFRATLYFYLMNALVYVDIDQGIHKVKI